MLAQICLEKDDRDQLQKLIEAYARRGKNDASAILPLLSQLHPAADFATFRKLAKPYATLPQIDLYLARHGMAIEAYQVATDGPAAFSSFSNTLFYNGNFKELRRLIEVHRKASPADSNVDMMEGRLLIETNQLDKAMALLKKRLEKSSSSLFGINREYVTACYMAGMGLMAYQELGRDSATFSWLAILYSSDGNAAALDALLKARPAKKNDRTAERYEVYALAFAGKPDDAVKLWVSQRREATEAAKKKKSPFGRDPITSFSSGSFDETDFAARMNRVGAGLAVYRIAEFPEKVFQILASHYRRENDEKRLAQLLEEHRVKRPQDPNLVWNRGFLELMRGNALAAEEILRAELAKPETKKPKFGGFGAPGGFGGFGNAGRNQEPEFPPVSPTILREGLCRAYIRQGKAVEYYRTHGSDPITFQYVARFCIDEREASELDALLDIHRKLHPKDSELNRIEGEAAFLKGDYEVALKKFSIDASPANERTKNMLCLVRLKRTAEAVRLAEDWEINTRNPDVAPLILAHAAAGNIKQVMRLMAIHAPRYDHLAQYYRHEDLGPLLRSEAMKQVRERFPPPALGK